MRLVSQGALKLRPAPGTRGTGGQPSFRPGYVVSQTFPQLAAHRNADHTEYIKKAENQFHSLHWFVQVANHVSRPMASDS